MQALHKTAFFDVAEKHRCWIGVREPNPLAEKWIGRGGYQPKNEFCKAKTSDNAVFAFAGLVANPNVCPDAFMPATRGEAIRKWNDFAFGGRLPPGYSVVERGNEKGLVKFHGAYLFADFDLMAINRSNANGEFLTTTTAEQKTLFDAIAPEINRSLGTPLIQHGAEFMWTKGVGARESEFVLWFGPGKRLERWPSSMPRGGH